MKVKKRAKKIKKTPPTEKVDEAFQTGKTAAATPEIDVKPEEKKERKNQNENTTAGGSR